MRTFLTACAEASRRIGYSTRYPQTAGCAGNVSARDPMDELEATEFFVDKLRGTKNNADFFDSMRRG